MPVDPQDTREIQNMTALNRGPPKVLHMFA